MRDLARRIVAMLRPSPARIYNTSILVGLAALGAGVDSGYSRSAALITVGALVIALAVFERVLPLFGGRH